MLTHDVISFVSEIEKNDPFSKACEIGLLWKIQSGSKTKFETPVIHDFISKASNSIHTRWIKGWSEGYPEHYEAHKAYIAASREDEEAFHNFVRILFPKSKNPELYVGHVWEVMNRMWRRYHWPYDSHLLKYPLRYIRKSAKTEFYKTIYNYEKDPLIKKLEAKMNEGRKEKELEPLFVEMFSYEPDTDDFLLTRDDWRDDLKDLMHMITISQACKEIKTISPERRSEIMELVISRYVFNITRTYADTFLGWPQGTAQTVWRYYNRHKQSFQTLIPKKDIIS